jgi:hypothetical protein
MKFDINTIISLASFFGGVGATAVTGFRWYNTAQRQKFAAEREFKHLQRDYKALSETVAHMDQRIEDLMDTLIEMRGALSVALRAQGVSNIDLPKIPNEE